jgi:hypothetical protein
MCQVHDWRAKYTAKFHVFNLTKQIFYWINLILKIIKNVTKKIKFIINKLIYEQLINYII